MNKKETLHSGKLYYPMGEEILEEQFIYMDMLREYNQTSASQQKERSLLLDRMFGSVGENCYIEAPFYANWGGHHTHLGKNVYANFGLTLVDDTEIFIGDDTMIGPNVTIATAGHPVLLELRQEGLQYNLPVHIGKNVWIGAAAVILPGVTIGDNTVIGAGSVVTKDIPADVVAVGNPCRILREIGEKDRIYYYRDRKIQGNIVTEDSPSSLEPGA